MDGSDFPPPRWSDQEADAPRQLTWQAVLATLLFLFALACGSVKLASIMPAADSLLPSSWADID